ncbi:5-bromo-4-chloroindolyl phosphate hydrolysis family protein [Paenibacillus daejeonensis]|uniref:5-bromo-4-chloroindolyl phosphate hydrolysis family protein n=1 Tax=Paenibacillus daejeonensis TaxID=135193 RepID=UPI0012F81F6F|nr:5-bromo-4-chloroindolyl phosphate hydrolysis family protein [Paenibacillus daejeonensis]
MPLVLLLLIIAAAMVLIIMLAKQQLTRTADQPSSASHRAKADGYALPESPGYSLASAEHPLSGRAQQALDTAGQQLTRLRTIAVRLSDQEVAAKIHALCTTSESISEKIRQNPSGLALVQRHYDYYLPTALGLMEQYDRLIHSEIYTKEMEFQVKRMESLLPGLRSHFDKYYRKLVRHELIDIEVEVNTLEQVMRSERVTG